MLKVTMRTQGSNLQTACVTYAKEQTRNHKCITLTREMNAL